MIRSVGPTDKTGFCADSRNATTDYPRPARRPLNAVLDYAADDVAKAILDTVRSPLTNCRCRPRHHGHRPVIAVLGVAHFIELSSEQIFRPHDKRFDLSVEGRRIGRCVSSRHIAPRTELCNCRINAVKFDRLDAPFAERVFCAADLAVLDRPQDRRPVQARCLRSRCECLGHVLPIDRP
jgi:hypothetical protein